jgi:2-polyprenyl-3-methyl-5-hydroxy-6-metoxy-1,4-benzoquinol methylase
MIRVEACPICGSFDRRLEFWAQDTDYGYPGQFPIYRCITCTGAYLGLVPSRSEIGEAYPACYSEYSKQATVRLRLLSKLLALVSNHGQPAYFNLPLLAPARRGARALDVGAGNGWASCELVQMGWNAYSVDFSRASLELAHQCGAVCALANASRLPFRENVFDLVMANNVLEHIYEPTACLVTWRALLRENGRIVICVPNFDALDRRMFTRNWYGLLSVPRHLIHFTKASLQQALERAGFARIEVKSAPYPSAGGTILRQIGFSFDQIRNSRSLAIMASLGTPLDIFSYMSGNGSNLVATASA